MSLGRETWSSRSAFVLAAIGSAIGLGNVWRFPYIAYANGGGAFLVAYLACLLLAGIPLLMLEFSLGHMTRQAAPGAFAKLHPRLQWFGWLAAGVGFVIVCYYAVIMGWCMNYVWHSVTLAWESHVPSAAGVSPVQDFFFNRFLGLTSEPWDMGGFRWPILVGFTLSWVWIIASIWKGTKTVGKVVFYTVTIPWLLLIVFTVRGMTLPGASEGLSFYLTPDWARLADPRIWLAAVSQIFFSLSVGFAIMIAYGSFLPSKTNIAANAFIVGIADSLTAFVGGLAVFSALGHQAHQMGVPVAEVVRSGPGLAFVAYPEIISSLPLPSVFGVLFFVMLLTLAIDSAFSLVEAVTAAVRDKWQVSHRKANLTVGVLAFLLGLPMLTGAGLHILDIVDHFMNYWGLTLVVLGEVIIVGWGYGADRMRKHISQNSSFRLGSWWDICVRWLLPMGILWMLYSEIVDRAAPYGSFGLRSQEFLFGWLVMILLPIVADVLASLPGRRTSG